MEPERFEKRIAAAVVVMPMTTSIALFDCPHCIDEFRFDYQKIAKLTYGWRVRVRCPDCVNIVQVSGCKATEAFAGWKER